jgi:SAM-dependent methyltransferase
VRVFREFHRILRPGGTVIVQTPNRWDYVSVIAAMTPHAVHQWVIPRITSRAAVDVFPTFYRANTRGSLTRAMEAGGFAVGETTLFNQYPAYLMFSPILFRLGVLWERVTSRHRALEALRGWILVVAEKPA